MKPQSEAKGARKMAKETARDIMTEAPQCIEETDTLRDAARIMADLGVGSLPICGEDDRLHGMITDRDIVITCVAEGLDPGKIQARDLADERIYTVDADASVDEILEEMKGHAVRRVPVIEDHRLVGIISQGDIAVSTGKKDTGELVGSISEDGAGQTAS